MIFSHNQSAVIYLLNWINCRQEKLQHVFLYLMSLLQRTALNKDVFLLLPADGDGSVRLCGSVKSRAV